MWMARSSLLFGPTLTFIKVLENHETDRKQLLYTFTERIRASKSASIYEFLLGSFTVVSKLLLSFPIKLYRSRLIKKPLTLEWYSRGQFTGLLETMTWDLVSVLMRQVTFYSGITSNLIIPFQYAISTMFASRMYSKMVGRSLFNVTSLGQIFMYHAMLDLCISYLTGIFIRDDDGSFRELSIIATTNFCSEILLLPLYNYMLFGSMSFYGLGYLLLENSISTSTISFFGILQ